MRSLKQDAVNSVLNVWKNLFIRSIPSALTLNNLTTSYGLSNLTLQEEDSSLRDTNSWTVEVMDQDINTLMS